ncbi:MAG: RidA family protein [Acinetobacter populi]|jgi:enamine deaminase RidA (YjgF/YER057c/UK114 family)|uniref:RidA family protein n=1 Tax=Acinetobacter populi TaxID=1582270 RepID=UPI0023571952|nr:RidA family protein [Acinetobacter populi]MCH4246984.1 RidA family protein [Acinetobacter populi]
MLNHTKSLIQIENPKTLYDPTQYAYSHMTRIRLKDVEEIIHIAGQGGEHMSGHMPISFEQQCDNVFHNIQQALNMAQLDWANIAKMMIMLVEHDRQKHLKLIACMRHYFQQNRFPACTLIPVQSLALPNMLIEIDATAYRFTPH